MNNATTNATRRYYIIIKKTSEANRSRDDGGDGYLSAEPFDRI
jgi:hypothetical protein